jgi:hypothetical protein
MIPVDWVGFGVFDKPRHRQWVYPPGLSVYIRRTQRFLSKEFVSTLEIGSVEAAKPGTGAFTEWLPAFEEAADKFGCIPFIENVMTPRFREFWEGRGYLRVPTAMPDFCYYRPLRG